MARITWTCADCLGPIFGSRGYLGVTFDEVNIGDGPIHWTAHHDTCQPDDAAGIAYDIGADQLDTPERVQQWTEHLSSKTWFARSDWAAVLATKGITIAAPAPEREPAPARANPWPR